MSLRMQCIRMCRYDDMASCHLIRPHSSFFTSHRLYRHPYMCAIISICVGVMNITMMLCLALIMASRVVSSVASMHRTSFTLTLECAPPWYHLLTHTNTISRYWCDARQSMRCASGGHTTDVSATQMHAFPIIIHYQLRISSDTIMSIRN